MGKYVGPKNKIARRFGVNLGLKMNPTKVARRLSQMPGVHGPTKKAGVGLTGYGKQLLEKQKAKFVYGMRERQFKRYVTEATRQKGDSSIHLLSLLERRMDNVIYRLGFAGTRAQARQLVNHKMFLLNNKPMDIPSHIVKAGDVITLKENKSKKKFFDGIVEKLSKFNANGKLKAEFVNLESEHSSMSACIGASASGSRVFTATSSQGLTYMAEMLPIASGLRLPIVMVNANRARSAPINIWNDHSDSMFVRDSGWIQIYCESVQEAYDTLIQAYRIAENKQISLPIMLCIDGFSLSHVMENISLSGDKEVAMFVGKFSPTRKLESKNPKTLGHVASPKDYYLFKQEQVGAIENSLNEIKKANSDFSQKFLLPKELYFSLE